MVMAFPLEIAASVPMTWSAAPASASNAAIELLEQAFRTINDGRCITPLSSMERV